MPLTSLAPNGKLDNLANDINVTFHGVSSDLHPANLSLVPDDDGDYFPEDYVIEPYQVERKLAHMNPHKAGGPDEIPNWFWRDFSAWLAEPHCCIFNYTSGCVPFHVETGKCNSST